MRRSGHPIHPLSHTHTRTRCHIHSLSSQELRSRASGLINELEELSESLLERPLEEKGPALLRAVGAARDVTAANLQHVLGAMPGLEGLQVGRRGGEGGGGLLQSILRQQGYWMRERGTSMGGCFFFEGNRSARTHPLTMPWQVDTVNLDNRLRQAESCLKQAGSVLGSWVRTMSQVTGREGG